MRRKRSAIEQALTTLYELLEQYAPLWYTQEHREIAERALGRPARRARIGGGIHEFGELRVDLRRIEVTLHGEPVSLKAREFQLLRYLIERPGIAVSRTELLQAVWGYSVDSSSRTLDVHIASLRRKLEKDPVSPAMIATIKGLGYRFDWRDDVLRHEGGPNTLESKRKRMAG